MEERTQQEPLLVGIDVGSTTVKGVVLDPASHETLAGTYLRHHAHQLDCARRVLDQLAPAAAGRPVRVAVTGSGGKVLADALQVPYVQEVVANSIAVAAFHPSARVAIELGGQDAKMIFFEHAQDGTLKVEDMRMNGSCAGGTGAFLDEIASLLKVPVEQLDDAASRGTSLYSISGRCGVFAKTDIQPLVNQGTSKEDIALSTFHAVAKQTLGGLAQGLDVVPPVIFEGGPLTFNPTLIRVFQQRLGIGDDDVIVPESPELIVAKGAALSLQRALGAQAAPVAVRDVAALLDAAAARPRVQEEGARPFFESPDALAAFRVRHELRPAPAGPGAFQPGSTVRAHLGIDSGSTTTKFALVDDEGHLLDSFYASNEGEPLDVARQALLQLHRRWQERGVELDVRSCTTTGYGEMLFAAAFHADFHVVETVAHAMAAARYVDDATFILDIGGQDMKAIWIDGGIVTDILVNEACSSGCGSFLENFAKNLGLATADIADAAFRSKGPASLGSRCTVFMTSSVVTEQKNGKTPDDIMAGLCRSIIENVFTKVIRVANLDALGPRIVVQGGTFCNDAVLAAFEDYVGRPVTRAPYPGLMGAIGAALFGIRQLAAQNGEAAGAGSLSEAAAAPASTFVGLAHAGELAYTQESNVTCPFCTNNCSRQVVTFGDGGTYVTGNRCERGAVVGDPRDEAVRARLREARAASTGAANLFDLREQLLMADYPAPQLAEPHGVTVGLPRVLAFWDTMPFWTVFWRSLGFDVRLSRPSSRDQFEAGLHAVASDTICFPAKLVHGHVRDLERAHVDRIFMPSITAVPSENTEATSESMCAVVKGYAIVMRNSDNPEQRMPVHFDAPLFHWHTQADRARQLCAWMWRTFRVAPEQVRAAIAAGDEAMKSFRSQLLEAGARTIDEARAAGSFAVVLASRPYHNDPLVNHGMAGMFARQGIAVLPPDAVPGIQDVDLSRSRLDIVNNYHARMLSCAITCAEDPALEYAQVVSFGCGHDAYLTDEIVRLMHQISDKSPLVLKVDESDVPGPLHIRIRSFIETIQIKRAERSAAPARALPDPYPVKFTRADRRERVILVPNTSHAFSQLMAAVFSKQGVRAVPIPIGREEAIRLGKKYVHNDICFPAQITIGECLAELESGRYDDCDVAVGTGKYIGDCRLTHYGALLRRALDAAGYAHVPIITNDDVDYHDLHPGFKMSALSAARIAAGLPMIDALEALLRRMRPYELVPGTSDAAFELAVDEVMDGMRARGIRGAEAGFKRAIALMNQVDYDRSEPRPRVLIVGEYLLNFHPGANHEIERYLEENGMEVVEARMTDVIRKTYFYQNAQVAEYGVEAPRGQQAWLSAANALFEHAHNVCDRIGAAHPLYEPPTRMGELVEASDPIIHHTFDAGEGVLIPAEIIHHAEHGCEAFIILQPFGCLPNHIVGRGIVKRLRELYPTAQILSLDYDPDVSFANIENRLQMLVMNVREAHAAAAGAAGARDLDQVAEDVAAIAQEAGVLAELMRTRADTMEGAPAEGMLQRLGAVRDGAVEALRREDALASRAKEALAAARAQAQLAGDAAAENVTAAAVRVYDLTRSMRSHTRSAIAELSELTAGLSTDADRAARDLEAELRSRAERVRTAAERFMDELGAVTKR